MYTAVELKCLTQLSPVTIAWFWQQINLRPLPRIFLVRPAAWCKVVNTASISDSRQSYSVTTHHVEKAQKHGQFKEKANESTCTTLEGRWHNKHTKNIVVLNLPALAQHFKPRVNLHCRLCFGLQGTRKRTHKRSGQHERLCCPLCSCVLCTWHEPCNPQNMRMQ